MEAFSENSTRINQILNHDLFLKKYGQIQEAEMHRKFCRHNMVHFLDVARIAMIMNLQEKCEVEYDLIYATALLHDIGRFEQYENGTPHEQASVPIAKIILYDCGYTMEETEEILSAILSHRNREIATEQNLKGLLYRADKMSRSCFACDAQAECDWKQEKKNLLLRY